jgi:hypothetical protein
MRAGLRLDFSNNGLMLFCQTVGPGRVGASASTAQYSVHLEEVSDIGVLHGISYSGSA